MKTRILVIFLTFLVPVSVIEGKTNGYLSFEYFRKLQNSGQSPDSFHNVQLGLVFSGALSPNFEYSAELRWEENKVELDQAWLRFFSSESFGLKLGLFLVPFGKYNPNSRPHETLLIHLPLNVVYAFPSRWRDIGALAEGRVGSLTYAGYIGNGLREGESLRNGQQFSDNNSTKGIGGRIAWFLSQSFEVAYSLYRGKADGDDQRLVVLQNIDVTWSPEGFEVLTEYTRGDLDNPDGFVKGHIEGFFVQTSLVMQNFRPVVCYQKMAYTDLFHGQGFVVPDTPGDGIHMDQTRWAFGLVFVPIPSVLLKLEYDLDRDRFNDQKTSSITFQLALSW